MAFKCCILLLSFFICLGLCNGQKINFPSSFVIHSHNDYAQQEPIFDALNNGATSLEVDVFYFNESIVISHDDKHLEGKAYFESSYLHPLVEYLDSIGKSIFLFIDVKKNHEFLLDRLNTLVSKYNSHLYSKEDKSQDGKHIKILLSGDFAKGSKSFYKAYPYFYLDGRMDEAEYSNDSILTPIISANFKDISNWKGRTRPSKRQVDEINDFVMKVHTNKQKVRFWNTPDEPIVWTTLLALNVDVIGTDDPVKLNDTLRKYNLLNID